MKPIEFRPEFSQPMVADLTMWLEKNKVFDDPGKEAQFRRWIENEIIGAKPHFDKYTLSSMTGQMIRCVFLGMFLEKAINDKQMCVLKFEQSQPTEDVK